MDPGTLSLIKDVGAFVISIPVKLLQFIWLFFIVSPYRRFYFCWHLLPTKKFSTIKKVWHLPINYYEIVQLLLRDNMACICITKGNTYYVEIYKNNTANSKHKCLELGAVNCKYAHEIIRENLLEHKFEHHDRFITYWLIFNPSLSFVERQSIVLTINFNIIDKTFDDTKNNNSRYRYRLVMNKQLLSWAANLTYPNKWDRLSFSKKGTHVAAWIWTQDDKFHANVFNELPGEPAIIEQKGFDSLDDAKAFADTELKKQGYKI